MILKTDPLPYQQAAEDKLIGIRVGALYMEMGTGKTRVGLGMIKRRLDAGKISRAIWLCPCSIRESVKADMQKHTDGWEDVIGVWGIESLSSSLRIFDEIQTFIGDGHVMLVVDESSLIKNHMAIRSRRITSLAGMCRYRLILNGTPISKNEADLFSQWNLLDWRILGYRSFWAFARNHLEYHPTIPRKIVRTLNVKYLVEKIEPYTYQVKMADCFELPDKKYNRSCCFMTDDQDVHYNEVADELMMELDELKPATIYRLFSGLQAVISGRKVDLSEENMHTSPFFKEPSQNPRIILLMKELEKLDNEKVLIFAKYTHEIKDIVRMISEKYGEGAAVPFYGEVKHQERDENLEKFNGAARFMVANKVCAGLGLNLQFCRNVVFYSNDWDYATRIQAEDRVHRIGQDKEVRILDLYTADSLDERILKCLDRKESLLGRFKDHLKNSGYDKAKLRKWIDGVKEDEELGEDLPQQKCV